MLMLGIPKSSPPLPKSQLVRLTFMGVLLAAMAYLFFFVTAPTPIVDPTEFMVPHEVAVPDVDQQLLAKVEDDNREQRLVVPAQQYSYLLKVALNVASSDVAHGLGMPEKPIPVAEVRQASDHMRGRWLWYKGVIEDLNGPRKGHPLERDGYSIYEATLRLDDGEHVRAAFSIPPGEGLHKGSYAMVSGFMLMLSDTTFPTEIHEAPMLIGREIKRAYADWPAITELDPQLLGKPDDGEFIDGRYEPNSAAFLGLWEEQDTPLWLLGAYARDNAGKWDRAQWRQRRTVNDKQIWDELAQGQIARGTPVRMLGILAREPKFKDAPQNPAGIKYWTEAWVQVRDLGGKLFPIWIPGKVEGLQIKDGLEVRCYFFKRYAYDTLHGGQARTAAFVAAGLDKWVPDIDPMLLPIGIAIAAGITLLVVWLFFSQRRERKDSAAVFDHLIERRRKRRGATVATSEATQAPPTS